MIKNAYILPSILLLNAYIPLKFTTNNQNTILGIHSSWRVHTYTMLY